MSVNLEKHTKKELIKIIGELKSKISLFEGIRESQPDQISPKHETLFEKTLLKDIAESLPNVYMSVIEHDLTVGFTAGQEFKKLNLDPETFVGLSLEMVFKDKADYIKEQYLKTFKGEPCTFELNFNGQIQLYKTIPLTSEDGKINRILSIVENITEKKKFENELRFMLDTEMAASEIAANFLNINTINIGDIIENALETLGKLNNAARSALFLISEDRKSASMAFEWCQNSTDSQIDMLQKVPLTRFKYHYRRLLKGETISVSSFEDYPLEAVEEKEWMETHGFYSYIGVPIFKGQSIFGVLYVYGPKGKKIKWPIISIRSIYFIGNLILNLLERTKTERKMNEINERYRLISENTSDSIWAMDQELKFNYLSPSTERLFGYSLEEWQTLPWNQFVHPDYMNAVNNVFETLSSRPDLGHQQEVISVRHKNGREMWVEFVASALLNEEGEFNGAVGVTRDVSDRRKAELEYQTMFREMLDGIAIHEIICDDKGKPVDYRFLAVNPAFERMTGLTAKDTIGNTVMTLLPGTESHWIDTYGKVALTGEPVTFENVSKELGKYFLVTAFSPSYGQFVCIFQDITKRKEAEAEKEVLHKKLVQAQKMEAIGTLAGGIAHDFNNILGVIMGYAELSIDDLGNPQEVSVNLANILKASERAKEMVQQILAFSRADDLTMSAVNMGKIIQEAVTLLRSTIPTTIEIQLEIEKNLPLIFGNPTQVHQVLINLCANAAHAIDKEGGSIRIVLQHAVFNSINPMPNNLDSGTYLQLIIEDTGCGMPQKILDRIFEPYFTTKKAGEGTGMGLAVVYGIVKKHRGEINVKTKLGKGSSFFIYFPIIPVDLSDKPDNKKEKLPLKGNERILFVDDEPQLIELGTKILERLGYQVTNYSDSKDALECFQSTPTEYDLIVTDMTMPKMSGLNLAAEIHRIRKDIPIVLCTGFSDRINGKDNPEGISAVVMKPFRSRNLAESIRAVLDKKY